MNMLIENNGQIRGWPSSLSARVHLGAVQPIGTPIIPFRIFLNPNRICQLLQATYSTAAMEHI